MLDSLLLPGKWVLYSLIQNYLNKKTIHYFAFENKAPEKFCDNITVHDFFSDNNGWLRQNHAKSFVDYIKDKNIEGLIVIDSLAHFIVQYGIAQTCKILSQYSQQKPDNKNVQFISLLHEDVLQNKDTVIKYIEHISTLYIRFIPTANKNRVQYKYKKPGGKLISKVEEFYLKNSILYTTPLEKIDPKKLLANTTSGELPENMSTFKISLDDQEKESRGKLVLPYTV